MVHHHANLAIAFIQFTVIRSSGKVIETPEKIPCIKMNLFIPALELVQFFQYGYGDDHLIIFKMVNTGGIMKDHIGI